MHSFAIIFWKGLFYIIIILQFRFYTLYFNYVSIMSFSVVPNHHSTYIIIHAAFSEIFRFRINIFKNTYFLCSRYWKLEQKVTTNFFSVFKIELEKRNFRSLPSVSDYRYITKQIIKFEKCKLACFMFK